MMGNVSLRSGGCVKFDLKAWDDSLHQTLCGVSNKKTLENFGQLSKLIPNRPDPPFLIASTLLVPGYIDEQEVHDMAQYIRGLNPEIPYSLLAFYPSFYLRDLPTTSRKHALRCQETAKNAGIRRVRIGNIHLLSEEYD
jgi:pyruvate formate lyase activating enzyme